MTRSAPLRRTGRPPHRRRHSARRLRGRQQARPVRPGRSLDVARRPGSDRDRRLAWVSLCLFPVTFVLALVVGEGLLSMQGYDTTEQTVPLGPTAVAAVPAMLVLLTSPAAGVWFGLRARRRSPAAGGADPVTVGLWLGGLFVVLNVFPLLLR